MSGKICIINYGMGNVYSLANMIMKIGGDAYIAESISDIEKADKLLLPGVGSFDNAVTKLHYKSYFEAIDYKVSEIKTPILCICLGMQLITKRSEEGKLSGFGWIDAETIKFNFSEDRYKIPHMGWNNILIKRNGKLSKDIIQTDNPRFYFAHSYYVKCNDPDDILFETEYGIKFTSAIEHDNIFATQFHPEKSHSFGKKLIHSFLEI